MTEEEYQYHRKKMDILDRYNAEHEALMNTFREMEAELAKDLLDLELEHRRNFGAEECIGCRARIERGASYCASCDEKIKKAQSSNPLMALDLTDKKAVAAFFADPANRDNPLLGPPLPLLEKRSADET